MYFEYNNTVVNISGVKGDSEERSMEGDSSDDDGKYGVTVLYWWLSAQPVADMEI